MWTWPRVAVTVVFVAGGVALAIVHQDALAGALIGAAGGMSMPAMRKPAG